MNSPALPIVTLDIQLPDGPEFRSGDELIAEILVAGVLSDGAGDLSLTLFDERDLRVYETLLSALGTVLPPLNHGDAWRCQVTLPLPLAAGRYRLRCGYHAFQCAELRPFVYQETSLMVLSEGPKFSGLVNLQARVETLPIDSAMQAQVRRQAVQWQAQTPDRILFGNDDTPFLISGFYAPEKSDTGRFRWTGDQACFQLRLSSRRLCMKISASRLVVDSRPVHGELWLGEEKAGDFTLKSHPATVSINCPARHVGTVVTLRLKILDSWLPADFYPGNQDRRLLGVALVAAECA